MHLELTGLSANANLYLEGAKGQVLHRSLNASTSDDLIIAALVAGTYYIRIDAEASRTIDYQLHYRTENAPPAFEGTAPTFASATVNGTSLVITFTENLGAAANLVNSAFTVQVSGATVNLSSTDAPVISGTTVTLTLATAVAVGATVTVSYTKPGSGSDNKLVDTTDDEVATFADQMVNNSSQRPPPPPGAGGGSSGGGTDPPGGGGGGSSGGGGGGGGGGPSRDLHGNTAAQATPVPLDSARMASTAGRLNPATDVDYFTVAVPHAGVLVVETTGRTDTVGTVWQDGEELASADSGGARQNFRLSVRVQAEPVVVIAVQGNGRQTGMYTLQTTLIVGYLENPGAASFQSGIGVLSGWVCAADAVEIALNGVPQMAAYGTERRDTEAVCGDTDNGFGLLFNWNLLGDGEHEVVAFVDGVELSRTTVTVTTLGTEFLREVTGACAAEDFPMLGETVTVTWQQTQQNFVLARGPAPTGENRVGVPGVGTLENPGSHSFQSGIGVISGWVCAAEEVEVEIGDTGRQLAAYGTERVDTAEECGDTDNGFGLLFNWNLLGEGEHEVVAFVDGEELGRATVQVTTVGEGAEEEFLRGVEGECVVDDFPMLGETVTLEWQQNQQNFVITAVE